MSSNTSSSLASAEDLRQLAADLAAAERHIARAVVAAGRLAGSGVCEEVEGLPLDMFIGLAVRLTGADRAMIVGAGEALRHMPVMTQLFLEGALSWGQVRRIVSAVRGLRLADRAELDERIGATAQQWNGVGAFGPDQLCDAIDAAAAELRAPRTIERREAAARQANFLSVQRSLLGRVQLFGDYDEVTAAPIVTMLEAAAGAPSGCGADAEATPATAQPDAASAGQDDAAPADQRDATSGDEVRADAGDEPAPRATRRGGQYAQSLADVAAAYLAGGLGASRARPLITAHVDLSQVHVNNAGVIELNVRGPLPRISLAALELLSTDADCRVVLFDGKRPLAVSRKLHAEDLPDDVAFAVGARDLGDRWPASNDPLGHTENHHITWRSRGGVHHVDDIVRLARRHHRLLHDHQWQMRLNPKTGMLTITRGRRVWRSLPRGTPLSQPANGPPVPPPGRRRRAFTPEPNATPDQLPF
ncbi:MAG: hypothetical protein GEU74_04285 [Nitriliruptorales bacterium]|nr:hypothetical protein [Nitriliruptorales bacterium]